MQQNGLLTYEFNCRPDSVKTCLFVRHMHECASMADQLSRKKKKRLPLLLLLVRHLCVRTARKKEEFLLGNLVRAYIVRCV